MRGTRLLRCPEAAPNDISLDRMATAPYPNDAVASLMRLNHRSLRDWLKSRISFRACASRYSRACSSRLCAFDGIRSSGSGTMGVCPSFEGCCSLCVMMVIGCIFKCCRTPKAATPYVAAQRLALTSSPLVAPSLPIYRALRAFSGSLLASHATRRERQTNPNTIPSSHNLFPPIGCSTSQQRNQQT